MKYKRCRKHELLATSKGSREVVSTTRLRELLGEEKYQVCCRLFRYEGAFPRPEEVELFLKWIGK